MARVLSRSYNVQFSNFAGWSRVPHLINAFVVRAVDDYGQSGGSSYFWKGIDLTLNIFYLLSFLKCGLCTHMKRINSTSKYILCPHLNQLSSEFQAKPDFKKTEDSSSSGNYKLTIKPLFFDYRFIFLLLIFIAGPNLALPSWQSTLASEKWILPVSHP